MAMQMHTNKKTGKVFAIMPMENYLALTAEVAKHEDEYRKSIDLIDDENVKAILQRKENQLNNFLGG